MNRRNYQKELEKIIERQTDESRVPRLLLHSCCAPCSSYVLEYLSQYFEITVFYYNPNISPKEEYEKRVEEQRRLIEALPSVHPIRLEAGPYEPERFYQSMDYTVRITAAVFFRSGNGKPLVKTHEKTQNKNVNNDGNLRL